MKLTNINLDEGIFQQKQLLLFLPPILLFLTYVFFKTAQGPYYLGNNSDPEYVYLINGLNLAQLIPPGHVDHPGTTLQWLAALVIRTLHLFTGKKSLEEDVLKNPEYYLTAINYVLLVINLFSVWRVGVLIKRFASIFIALTVQLAYFISTEPLYALIRVTPESLLNVASLWLSYLIIRLIYLEDSTTHRRLYIVSFATVIGLGIATKINFVPFAILPLFLLSKNRDRIRYIILSIIICVLVTIPVLFSSDYFFNWIKGMIIHSDLHGRGNTNVINIQDSYKNLTIMLLKERWLSLIHFFLTLSLPLSLIFLKKNYFRSYSFVIHIGLWATISLQLLIVIKHYNHWYLIPSLILSVASLIFLYRLLSQQIWIEKYRKAFMLTSVVVFLFAALFNIRYRILPFRKNLLTGKEQQLSIAKQLSIVKNNNNFPVIYYYRSSSQAFAFHFALPYSGKATMRYTNVLKKMYPDSYVYNIFDGSVYYWTDQINLVDLLAKHKKLIVSGSYITEGNNLYLVSTLKADQQKLTPFLEPLYHNNIEAIYISDSLGVRPNTMIIR